MARLYSVGFELNSTTTGVEGDTYSVVTVSTVQARSGTYALRANPSAAAPFWRTQVLASDSATAIVFKRFYLYIATMPTGSNTQISRVVNSSNVQQACINLTTGGLLQLLNGSAVQVGSSSSALSLATWYRVEYSWNPATGATTAYINGTSFATGTGTTGSWSRVLLGGITGTPTGDWYFDDVAVNDNSGSFQNTLPGDGKIIYLKPNAAGDVNGYLVTAGGTVGAANNFTRVQEVTPDDITSYNASVLLAAEDLYNCDDSGIGASDTVNVVSVGGRFADLVSSDATTSFKFEIEKTASGTKTQSAGIIPNTTVWRTNATAAPFNYPITTYQDPDGAAWTQTTLDSAQIGMVVAAVGVRTAGVSKIWMLVDYTPASGTAYTKSLTAGFSSSGVLSKQTSRINVATFSRSGGLSRFVSHLLTANYSTSGVLNWFVTKIPFTAVFTSNGVFFKQERKIFSGTASTSGQVVNRVVGKLLTAQFKTTGLLSRAMRRNLFGILLVSGQNAPLNLNPDFEIAPASNVPQTLNNNWINGTSTGSASRGIFGWYGNQIAAGVSWVFSQTQAHSGSWSMQAITVGNTITMMSVAPGFAVVGQGAIPAIVGASYTVSVWVNVTAASGSATTGLVLTVYRANYNGTSGNPSTTAVTRLTAVTGGWVQLSVTFTAGVNDNWLNPMVRIVTNDGAATLAMTAYIDDFVLTYTTATPFGAFLKSTNRLLVATFSDSGTIATQHGFSKLLTGIFQSSGQVVARSISRLFTGTQNASGTIKGRSVGRSFGGTYSASGLLTRFINRFLSGVYSGSGILTSSKSSNTHFQSLSGVYLTAGNLMKSTRRNLTANYSTSGVLNWFVNRKLVAIFHTSGVLSTVHARLKSLTATFFTSGTLKKRTGKSLLASYQISGGLKRSTSRIFVAVYKAIPFWRRFIKPQWSKIGIVLTSGSQTTIDVSGSNSAKVSAGDILDSVSSGTKTEALQSGADDATVSGSDTKVQL